MNGSWIADLHISPDLLIDVMETGGILTLPAISTVVLDRILTPEEVAGCRLEMGIDRPAYGLGGELFTVNLSYWEGAYRMLGPWAEVQAMGELVENAYVSLWRFVKPSENSSCFLFMAKP